MHSWSAGYTADVAYTSGFYRELTPALLEFAALGRNAQVQSANGSFAMAELGCGRGFSTNVIAAANPHARFVANDFNPAHVAEARALAASAEMTNVRFSDASFAEFVADPNIPPLDIVALHGILSWINEDNQQHIVDFVKRHLKPGGLVYVSYNCLPGWAPSAPLRRLMIDFGAGEAGGSVARLEKALGFIGRLKETKARYFTANAAVSDRFDKLAGQPRNYLVHEYMNADWNLFYHSDVAALFSEAKTSFLCSAHILDNVESLNLADPQRKLLAEIESATLRETTRDFMINQQFRRDLFIKGLVALSLPETRERWLDTRFALSLNRADVPMKVTGGIGEAALQAEIYEPFLDALAGGPKTLREMRGHKEVGGLDWARVTQVLTVLVGAGHVQPCLGEKGESRRRDSTRRFNRALMEKARHSADLLALASPVTGGGIGVDRMEQLFLLARQHKAADAPAFAWQAISAVGQRLTREGTALVTPEENLAELATRHATFVEKRLGVLEKLGIA